VKTDKHTIVRDTSIHVGEVVYARQRYRHDHMVGRFTFFSPNYKRSSRVRVLTHVARGLVNAAASSSRAKSPKSKRVDLQRLTIENSSVGKRTPKFRNDDRQRVEGGKMPNRTNHSIVSATRTVRAT